MKIKYLIFLFLSILMIQLISANGLTGSNETIYINKIYGEDINTIITIHNSDTFNFYNLTLDTAGFSMVTIPILAPNQSANVTVKISNNENYIGKVKFKFYYEASVGASNQTIPVLVNYIDGASPCVFNVVKGDTVTWTNTDTKVLDLYNTDTLNKITTIQPAGTYSQTFTNPLLFNSYFTWLGFDFSYCSINVLSDTGFITNPNLDYLASINLKIDYKPTTIEATYLVTSYSMSVLDSQDGLMTIRNTGNEIARNIILSGGNWFVFTPNNFDLNPNVTRTIAYKIDPVVTATNDTNKTYTKNVGITGNFPNISQNFSIFLTYADLSSSQFGYASLEDYLKKFCLDNPDICGGGTKIIYRDATNGSNLTQDQFRKIIEFWSNKFDLVQEELTFLKEQGYIVANQSVAQTNLINQTTQSVENLEKDKDDTFSFIQLLIIGLALFIIVIGGAVLILYYKKKKEKEKLRRWI